EAELIGYRHGAADDRLLQWVAACALPPVLFWDWTLFVGEKLSFPNEYFLHADHLFKILQLPWFVEGNLPPGVQSTLLAWLEKTHPAFLDALRHEWDKVLNLETNLPPVGSIAWEGHRVSVVLNQLMLQPKRRERQQLENELDQLLASGVHEHALVVDYVERRQNTFGNLLSARFRKFVQTKQGLFWRWRDWVWQLPLWLGLVLAISLLHYTEPVRTYRIGAYIKSLALSSDNKYLLIGSGDRRVSLWSTDGDWVRGYEGYRDEVSGAEFGRDNTSVLTGTADNFIAFWDIWGQVELSRQGPAQLISAIAFDPDKKFAVLGYYETGKGVVAIVDLATNALKMRFEAHQDAITDIALSPSGDAILTGGRDKLVKLWDMNGNLLHTLSGHTDLVHAVDFSPNGDRLLSAGRDNTARLWDREGRELQVFRGHENDVYDVQFGPDNASILTASADHTARIWSLNGQTRRVLDGHFEPVRIARFSADGHTVVTGSSDGTVKLWKN
ncbi:MAG: WD40 repeat domain-containing protein, partial [Saprospiraceae bacterium]|nr:WD40 repeat domain-containing protein [Saprospiraceae bacterium]